MLCVLLSKRRFAFSDLRSAFCVLRNVFFETGIQICVLEHVWVSFGMDVFWMIDNIVSGDFASCQNQISRQLKPNLFDP